MRLEVSLTKAEAKALRQRDTHWKAVAGRATAVDRGPTVNWPPGIRKSNPRLSAEAKLLAALDSQLEESLK